MPSSVPVLDIAADRPGAASPGALRRVVDAVGCRCPTSRRTQSALVALGGADVLAAGAVRSGPGAALTSLTPSEAS